MSAVDQLVHRALAQPRLYSAFQRAIGVETQRAALIREYVAPKAGERILDIGCGTAEILSHLADTNILYEGLDFNEEYIAFARARWAGEPRYSFHVATIDVRLSEHPLLASPKFDVVMAIGVLHHLDDESAAGLVETAAHALKPGGRLVTMDPALFPGMSWMARQTVANDRGQFIRTEGEYRSLLGRYFEPAHISTTLRRNIVKVPGKSVYSRCIR